jgi:hypothetical protein
MIRIPLSVTDPLVRFNHYKVVIAYEAALNGCAKPNGLPLQPLSLWSLLNRGSGSGPLMIVSLAAMRFGQIFFTVRDEEDGRENGPALI